MRLARFETETWSRDKPTFVVVQLKNISDKDVSLLGIYTFELSKARHQKSVGRKPEARLRLRQYSARPRSTWSL